MTPVQDEATEFGGDAIALAGVAHDLDNLLGAMALRADVVERQLERGDQHGALASVEVIRRAIEESRRLTVGMRSIVRRTVPATRPVDLVRLLDQLAPLLDAMAGERLTVERHVGEIPAVEASQLGLRRVFLNLVVNAREAIGDNRGSITISATEAKRGRRRGVELRVADTGPGIPAELLAKVTEPNVSSKAGSSGLGLTTVAEVVEASGGSLAIESRPQEGCTVILWIPAAGTSSDAAGGEEGSADDGTPGAGPSAPADEAVMEGEAEELTDLARG